MQERRNVLPKERISDEIDVALGHKSEANAKNPQNFVLRTTKQTRDSWPQKC